MPRFVRFEHLNPNVATAHNMMSRQLTMVTRAMKLGTTPPKSTRSLR